MLHDRLPVVNAEAPSANWHAALSQQTQHAQFAESELLGDSRGARSGRLGVNDVLTCLLGQSLAEFVAARLWDSGSPIGRGLKECV